MSAIFGGAQIVIEYFGGMPLKGGLVLKYCTQDAQDREHEEWRQIQSEQVP